ncbi:MAG: hypothetical protein CMJ85_04855, partial [Planctomycetes bacterium]|nr:hypothetical protein [Planctomycetota bacterium]
QEVAAAGPENDAAKAAQVMSRLTAWFVHATALCVGITGLVYGWMRYFVESDDEFSLANHPAEPAMHEAHVLFAPVLVFACGMIWLEHVLSRLRSGVKERRRTGIALAGLLLPMIASGYLIQVSVSEEWRAAWIWVHVVTSLLWLVTYLVHQLQRARAGTMVFELDRQP